jgi:polysaccharide export outer membrane protein
MKSDSASSPSASFRPKSLDASSTKKNKNLPASAERYLSSLDSVSSSVPPGEKTAKEIPKTTVSPKVPEKHPAIADSVASSSAAAAMEPPVSDARTEKNPIPPAPASTVVPPTEKPENLEKAVFKQASAAKIPPAVQAQSSSAGKVGSSASSQYRIGPEDALNVSVWGDKEMTMDVIVRPDGKISLPLVQDIQAEGLTASELADTIHQKLLPYIKDPNVSVIVKQINSPKFSVMGYVGRPGTFPLRGDVTVLEALSMAGGFTPFASPRKIKLVRNADGKQEIRVVNYYDMIDKGGEGNYLLKAGDIIVVP